MKKWFVSIVTVSIFLFGCSSDEKVTTQSGPVDVEALEVKVDILTPEEVAVNEQIDLAVHVIQNNEDVNDADSVQFEVWESGYRDDGQMIDGELDRDGVYKAAYTFDHDGIYYMFAHTTARDLHVMPKQKIIVGNPDMSKVKEDNSDNSMGEMDMNEEDGSDENHSH